MENIEQSKEIQEVHTQTSSIVSAAKSIVIENDFDLNKASIVAKDISDTKKSVEERRQFFVRPLNEQVKKVNDLFKILAAPLLEADTLIRSKVGAYRTAQAEVARKEQARLDALAAKQQAALDKKAEKQGVEAPIITAPVVAQPAAKVGHASMRKDWRFTIVDAAKVPADYLVVDESKIRKAIAGGVREIAGVKIYQEETVVIR